MTNWSTGMVRDYQEGFKEGKFFKKKGGFYIILSPLFGQQESQFKEFPSCYLQGLIHGLNSKKRNSDEQTVPSF